jgi:hypothetical protein
MQAKGHTKAGVAQIELGFAAGQTQIEVAGLVGESRPGGFDYRSVSAYVREGRI